MTPLAIPCPHCAAQPDQGCLRRDGLPYGKVHNARRLAMTPACPVRMFANTRDANPRPCGEPLVTDLCARHQADRERLGGLGPSPHPLVQDVWE